MSIQSLRDKSEGVIAKILIGLIILVFALFGFGSITTFLAPTPKVATVDGEDITTQEMELAVERNRRLLLAQGRSPSDINEDELRNQVLQNLINRKLLTMAAESLGFYVSDESLDKEIVDTEAFQVDGVFSPDQFQLVLRSAGYSPLGYREEMRTDKKLQQLLTGIQGSAFMTDRDVERTSALAQQTRDVAFLRIDVESLLDKVDVSEAEIDEYYKNHPAEFMTEETVDLAYIEIKRSDLEDEVNVADEALTAFFEETRAVYAEEENRRLAHILIETSDQVSDDEAKAKIDSIYQRIVNGENFADLAKELSDDTGSAADGGDLGFNPPGSFVEPFEDAAFKLDLNQMSEPVKTEFGYHLIKLLAVEAARVPEFAEVRDRVEKEYRETKAEEMFVSKSASLSELAFESQDLEGPAAELGIPVKTTGPVSRTTKQGIAANADVMEAAFSPDVLLDRNNSRLIELNPNDHVVVHVLDHSPQEVKPLDAVSADVKNQIAHEKAAKLAESQASEIVQMLEDGSITRFVADKFGLKWEVMPQVGRNQMGLDREINAEAFKLPRPPEGTKSVGYAVLADGDAAVISVTNVVSKTSEEIGASEIKTLGRILANQQGGYEYRQFRDDLVAEGDVNRVK